MIIVAKINKFCKKDNAFSKKRLLCTKKILNKKYTFLSYKKRDPERIVQDPFLYKKNSSISVYPTEHQ